MGRGSHGGKTGRVSEKKNQVRFYPFLRRTCKGKTREGGLNERKKLNSRKVLSPNMGGEGKRVRQTEEKRRDTAVWKKMGEKKEKSQRDLESRELGVVKGGE